MPVIGLPSRWRAVRLLGRGGQADVWLAEDTELSEMVAVKVFREGLSEVGRERLRREVRLGRTLQHPGLVRVFELIEADGRPAVVLEWVRGGTVADRLREGAMPVAEVVVVALGVLQALEHLHGHRVVHRDIKPSNLLLDEAGGVKVTDYGLVRLLEGGGDLTRTATTVGTPTYMSPEQVRGKEPGAASDLYSLGVTLYEMLSGRPPFVGGSEFEVANLHLQEIPRGIRGVRPECPPWLARFVMTLLEKAPSDRYGSAGEALAVLQAARTPLSRRRRRLIGRIAAAVAALVLAGVGMVSAVSHWRAGTAERVEARGREVVGLDERGRQVWRIPLQQEVFQVVELDLTGDGVPETVVSAAADPARLRLRDADDRRGEVLVVTRRGRVLSQVRPENLLRPWPFEYPMGMRCVLHPLPTMASGERPLAVRCQHLEFLPAMLAVYWPAAREWNVALVHHGWIRDLLPVDGGEIPRVVVAGTNNRLGASSVAAMLDLLPPSLAARETFVEGRGGPGFSPDASRLLWYTALTPEPGYPFAVSLTPEDEIELTGLDGAGWRLDRWGNDLGGPNAGLDLGSQRIGFLNKLTGYFPTFVPGKDEDLIRLADELRRRYPEVLREPIHGMLLDLAEARGMAALAQGDAAREILRRRDQYMHFPEVLLQLSHLEALSGRLDEARRLLELPALGFGRWFNHFQLQVRLAISTGDEERFAILVGRVAEGLGLGETADYRAAGLRTRANLWWDQVSAADTQVLSTGYEPAGTALACLVRWRLGAGESGDAEAMAEEARLNPDARLEFHVARTAALLGERRPAEALAQINSTVAALEMHARLDYSAAQTLELARALLVRALMESGDTRGALAEAQRLRPTLTEGLLPAILVDEALVELGS